jgi:hypothetical protein
MLELAGSNERRLAGNALKENAAARFTRVPGLPTLLLRIVRWDIVSVTACVHRCSVNGFSGSPDCCARRDPRVMHWICGLTSGALYTRADHLAVPCLCVIVGVLPQVVKDTRVGF